MSTKDKVAVVTGANKGIGFAIVKGLCQRFDGVVYLTSRDESRGKDAVAELKKESYYPAYHQLDVSEKQSVKIFKDYIKEKHGGIDILINNAGVSGLLDTSYEAKKTVIDINYRSALILEEYLFPLLRDGARVVNISSDCGHLSNVRNKDWIKRLSKKDLTQKDIDDFVDWYLESEKKGTFDPNDFADKGLAAYRVSKVALCALTMLQQKKVEERGICVNSMHPGLVSTDMTMGVGVFTPDQAAETPLYLVLDAPKSLKGKYIWFDKKEVDWFDYEKPYYFKVSSMYSTLAKNIVGYPVRLLVSPHLWVGVLSLGLIITIVRLNDGIIKATGF